MELDELLATGERLCREATPGPWEANYGGTLGHVKAVLQPGVHTPTVLMGDWRGVADSVTETAREGNMALAAFARNALPRLLKIAREADDLLDNRTCSCFGRGLPCARCEVSWTLLRDALEGREENDGKPR